MEKLKNMISTETIIIELDDEAIKTSVQNLIDSERQFHELSDGYSVLVVSDDDDEEKL